VRLLSGLLCILLAGPAWGAGEVLQHVEALGITVGGIDSTPTPAPTNTPTNTPTPTHTPTPGGPTATPTNTPTNTPTPVPGSTQNFYPEQQMTYLGACKPPSGTFGGQSFQHSGAFMGWDPVDSKIYFTSLLTGSTPNGLVAQITPCTPQIQANFTSLPSWTVAQNFADITGGRHTGQLSDLLLGDLLPRADRIYGTFWEAYTPTDADGNHGIFSANRTLSSGFEAGVWTTTYPEPNWSRSLFLFSSDWAALFGNRNFGAMRQTNQGNNNWGPSLYAIAEPSATPPLPADGTEFDSIELMHFPASNPMADYNRAMSFNDAVWIEAGGSGEYEAFVVTAKYAAQEYYGGNHDTAGNMYGCSGQGYHGEPENGVLLFFSPNELLEVKNGTRQPHEMAPYRTYALESRLYRTAPYCDTGYTSYVSGMAYNAAANQLWIAETKITASNPSSAPILHAYQLNDTQSGPRDNSAPNPPTDFTITPGDNRCTLNWTAATDPDGSNGTDGVGIAFYRILRDHKNDIYCPGQPQCPRWDETTSIRYIEASETTSFVDTKGIANGTTYTYQVEAVDRANKKSSRVQQTCLPVAPTPTPTP
jgi:hypothetical protein